MTLKDEVRRQFDQARAEIARHATPPGVMPVEGGPDIRFVTINANFAAVQRSLELLAARIDELAAEHDA